MHLNKKSKHRSNRLYKNIFSSKYHVLVFVIAFAITGGVYKLLSSEAAVIYTNDPGHASQCIQNTPSKTAVRPGEQFTAVVQLKNTGSTTYAGAFGIALADLNYPPAIWNASGYDLSSNIPPNGTATFNLRLRAPTTPGVYKFEWGIVIALNGFMRNACTGRTITVANPAGVSLLANSNGGNISVTRGSSLTLSWSSTNNPTSCNASGSWGGGKPGSGIESRTADTSVAGTKTYTLTCSNAVGGSSVTRTVTVNNPPATPSTPSSPSSPSRPSTPSSPSRPSTPSSPSVTIPSATAVTTPPPVPSELSAKIVDDTTVDLTWNKPEYEGILLGYELERTTDNVTWDKVHNDLITAEVFSDTDVKFETTYTYRLRAVGQNNLYSEYATTELTTNKFESNTEGETTLVSEDEKVSVVIPDSAIDGEAQCILRNDNDLLAPAKDGYSEFVGPYQILCKLEDGSIIGNFKEPISISVNNEGSGFKKLAYFSYASDWQEIEGTLEENIGQFQITDQTSFAILGQKSSTPLWLKILLTIIVLAATIFIGLRLLLFIKNRQEQNNINKLSDDYYHKEHGI